MAENEEFSDPGEAGGSEHEQDYFDDTEDHSVVKKSVLAMYGIIFCWRTPQRKGRAVALQSASIVTCKLNELICCTQNIAAEPDNIPDPGSVLMLQFVIYSMYSQQKSTGSTKNFIRHLETNHPARLSASSHGPSAIERGLKNMEQIGTVSSFLQNSA